MIPSGLNLFTIPAALVETIFTYFSEQPATSTADTSVRPSGALLNDEENQEQINEERVIQEEFRQDSGKDTFSVQGQELSKIDFLSNIPKDVLKIAANFLDLKSLLCLCMVNKKISSQRNVFLKNNQVFLEKVNICASTLLLGYIGGEKSIEEKRKQLEHFAKNEFVTALDFTKSNLNDEKQISLLLKNIPQLFPSIQSLKLCKHVDETSLQALRFLNKLQILGLTFSNELPWYEREERPRLNKSVLDLLQYFPALHTLHLRNITHMFSEKNLKDLTPNVTVKRLFFSVNSRERSHIKISLRLLEKIGNTFPQLESFRIPRIDSHHIPIFIRQFSHLKELRVSYLSIDDGALQDLGSLSCLTKFSFKYTNGNRGITKEGIRSFQEKLSRCEVKWTFGFTGWG